LLLVMTLGAVGIVSADFRGGETINILASAMLDFPVFR